MLAQPGAQLVLASTSAARRTMLAAAGVPVEIVAPQVDEAAVKQALHAEPGEVEPGDLALLLAQTKCCVVSEKHPDAIVIGADQVLAMEGRIFDKPMDLDAARDQLLALRGRTHTLETAVACARGGEVVWSHQDEAVLAMRPFSNQFLGHYVAAAGKALLTSVGAYQVELLGIQLFERIEGDHFTILGLPLLPLLDFLRREGALPA